MEARQWTGAQRCARCHCPVSSDGTRGEDAATAGCPLTPCCRSDTYGDTLPGLRFTVRYLRSTKLPGENAVSIGRLLDDHVRQANEEYVFARAPCILAVCAEGACGTRRSVALDLASRDKLSALQVRPRR